jgi:hypothetical protein
VWCSKCYRANSEDINFHICLPVNDEGAVWRRREDNDRYVVARDGDMWCFSFQCDRCWFLNIQGREPQLNSPADVKLLKFIRRVNLDIFWSRERSTVNGTYYRIRRLINLALEMNIMPDIPTRGPWPLADTVGFQLSILILRASLDKGRYSSTHQEFNTVRRLRSAYHAAFDSSYMGVVNQGCFTANKGKVYHLTESPSSLLLHVRFIEGLESRMGKMVKKQSGLDAKAALKILENCEGDLKSHQVSDDRKRSLLMFGSYLALSWGYSLRGNEGFMLEGSNLCKYINEGLNHSTSYVLAPLLGRFKNEVGEHLQLCVLVSKSSYLGFKFRWWLERLVGLLKLEGKDKTAGPAFYDEEGYAIRSSKMDEEFIFQLERVQLETDIIPRDIEVAEHFGIFRSIRIGSETWATERKVEPQTINLIHRWSTFERNRGSRPNMNMMDHYLDVKLVLDKYLEYSKAL